MNGIVKVSCFHFGNDWTDIEEISINLDEWVFFCIDYRGESWHIIGYKCDDNYKWTEEELSGHGVRSIHDLAEFIAKANIYKRDKIQPCKVSRFNNLHYSDSFYKDL